jgi:hypothetical protein
LRPGLLPLDFPLPALLELLRLLFVLLLQLLRLLLVTLLELLFALRVGVALFHLLLFLHLLLLHALALGVLLPAQLFLFALLLFRENRIYAVRVRRTIFIRPDIFRRPIFRAIGFYPVVAAVFRRAIGIFVTQSWRRAVL